MNDKAISEHLLGEFKKIADKFAGDKYELKWSTADYGLSHAVLLTAGKKRIGVVLHQVERPEDFNPDYLDFGQKEVPWPENEEAWIARLQRGIDKLKSQT